MEKTTVANADESSKISTLVFNFNPFRAGIPPYTLSAVFPLLSPVNYETLVPTTPSSKCAIQNNTDFIPVNATLTLNDAIAILNVTTPGFPLNQTSQQTLCNLNGLNVDY